MFARSDSMDLGFHTSNNASVDSDGGLHKKKRFSMQRTHQADVDACTLAYAIRTNYLLQTKTAPWWRHYYCFQFLNTT